jgi:putative two-component system response regulator
MNNNPSHKSNTAIMNKPSILIVDDERFFINLLTDLLQPNYHILSAASGQEAIELAQKHKIDLIILDIIMPQMDGYEVSKELNKLYNSPPIPIIFLTVKDDIDDELKGFELGAVDYITKPISPPIVLARVRTHIALKQAQENLQRYATKLEQLVAEKTIELRKEIAKTQQTYEKLISSTSNYPFR